MSPQEDVVDVFHFYLYISLNNNSYCEDLQLETDRMFDSSFGQFWLKKLGPARVSVLAKKWLNIRLDRN